MVDNNDTLYKISYTMMSGHKYLEMKNNAFSKTISKKIFFFKIFFIL